VQEQAESLMDDSVRFYAQQCAIVVGSAALLQVPHRALEAEMARWWWWLGRGGAPAGLLHLGSGDFVGLV
jgi:hypothetical protein